MKPTRSLFLPLIRRRKTHRLPDKPQHKVPDPLTSDPAVVHQALSDDLTFIYRPPPTAPTPFSYETAPASPLLQAQTSAPKNDTLLPPPMRTLTPEAPRMAQEAIAQMRALRAEDPKKWTRSVLAKRFNCTSSFVQTVAPLKAADRKAASSSREEQHQTFRDKWGEKRAFNQEVRRRRRELW